MALGCFGKVQLLRREGGGAGVGLGAQPGGEAGDGGEGGELLEAGEFGLSSSTTCLMRKLPKLTPRRPSWQFEME